MRVKKLIMLLISLCLALWSGNALAHGHLEVFIITLVVSVMLVICNA